ncbi:DUF5050 domain-containing protein [Paenibacillus filicis]|uniref:DUF5050 domain-containing protein n=1 Tax=Paenibacillus filicis TaxID=669464 RepID=A0ABU9DJV5_9BACL
MLRRLGAVFLAAGLVCSVLPASSHAREKEVKVSIPTFKVTVNGVQVDNTYRQYPLLVYNDITYMPMTYSDSRFLGLTTRWDTDKGLEITKTGISVAYQAYRGDKKNAAAYTATIPDFAVKAGGKDIVQSAEEYPLLEFREVTYFPLTWRFAVGEFGWSYQFDERSGLNLQSSNPQVQQIDLPGYSDGAVVESAGSIYYSGPDGKIMQSSAQHPEQAKEIFQLPVWNYGDGSTYVSHGLRRVDGDVLLWYHQGGAVMGSDNYIKLNPDGSHEEIRSGYSAGGNFGSLNVYVSHGTPPGPGNLRIKEEGQEYRPAGDPDYLYGWNWKINNGGQSGTPSQSLYMVGRNLYLNAFHWKNDTDISRIHKVNIDTGETTRVSDLPASDFVVQEDSIYAISNGKLYQIPLEGGPEKLLPTKGEVSPDRPFVISHDTIYYVDSESGELYTAGSSLSLNPRAEVKNLKLENGYLWATFNGGGDRYALIVWDADGKRVFATSDPADYVSVEGGRLTYTDNVDRHVYRVDLMQTSGKSSSN